MMQSHIGRKLLRFVFLLHLASALNQSPSGFSGDRGTIGARRFAPVGSTPREQHTQQISPLRCWIPGYSPQLPSNCNLWRCHATATCFCPFVSIWADCSTAIGRRWAGGRISGVYLLEGANHRVCRFRGSNLEEGANLQRDNSPAFSMRRPQMRSGANTLAVSTFNAAAHQREKYSSDATDDQTNKTGLNT